MNTFVQNLDSILPCQNIDVSLGDIIIDLLDSSSNTLHFPV